MACEGYNHKALMGNWYEDRQAPIQPKNANPDHRQIVEKDQGIFYPAPNGQLKHMNRTKRVAPWVTNGLIPSDGFKEQRSLTNTNYDQTVLTNYDTVKNKNSCIKSNSQRILYPESNLHTAQVKFHQIERQLRLQNMHEVTENHRDVQQNHSDFASTFRKHDREHNKFYNVTTNNHFYSGNNYVQSCTNLHTNRAAGFQDRPSEQQGIKLTSVVGSEKYKDLADPKDNTQIQRSWMPAKDKALLTAQNNLQKNQHMNETRGLQQIPNPLSTYRKNVDQTLPYDITNTLPLDVGVHKLQPKKQGNGAFARFKTDVTTVRNQPFSKK